MSEAHDETVVIDTLEQDPTSSAVTEYRPIVTPVVITLCVGIFLGITATESGDSWDKLRRFGYTHAEEIWSGAYWALVTSGFVHVNFIHLLLNVYWLWKLGCLLERIIGRLRMLGLIMFSGAISSSTQLAISDDTGIGSSGFVYAIFGFLYAARHRYPAVKEMLDDGISKLFIVWLFTCIALTNLDILPIANGAHFAGIMTGMWLGWLWIAETRPKRIVGFLGLGLLLAWAAIPVVYMPWSIRWIGMQGFMAHEAEDYETAIKYYTEVIRHDPTNAWAYFNRSVAYGSLGEEEQAAKDYQRALEIDPDWTADGQ